ncbi:MAG: DUF2934 domain-containing protein [Polyangiaceae bacterium]
MTAIYGALSDGTGDMIGSGLYLRANGKAFLVTAGHVVHEGWANYAEVVCVPDGGTVGLAPNWKISHPAFDLAVAEMGLSAYVPSITALTIDQLAGSSSDVDEHHLFVHGFPQARSHYTRLANPPAVVSETLPYVTQTHTTTWAGFDPAKHFAIEYPGPAYAQVREGGGEAALPPAHGLSGCGVWRLAGDLTAWTPESSRLIGIVQRWDHKNAQSLVVTRVEMLRDFLLEAIRRTFAHSNWEARGRRPGAEEDWRLAEECIRGLR